MAESPKQSAGASEGSGSDGICKHLSYLSLFYLSLFYVIHMHV